MQFQAMIIMGCLFMCLHLVLFFSPPPPPLFIYCFVCDGLVTFPRCKIGIFGRVCSFFWCFKTQHASTSSHNVFFFLKKAKKQQQKKKKCYNNIKLLDLDDEAVGALVLLMGFNLSIITLLIIIIIILIQQEKSDRWQLHVTQVMTGLSRTHVCVCF